MILALGTIVFSFVNKGLVRVVPKISKGWRRLRGWCNRGAPLRLQSFFEQTGKADVLVFALKAHLVLVAHPHQLPYLALPWPRTDASEEGQDCGMHEDCCRLGLSEGCPARPKVTGWDVNFHSHEETVHFQVLESF